MTIGKKEGNPVAELGVHKVDRVVSLSVGIGLCRVWTEVLVGCS